ncbi:hypothetical protein SLE2022_267150 [Rubroshorea leprosula]
MATSCPECRPRRATTVPWSPLPALPIAATLGPPPPGVSLDPTEWEEEERQGRAGVRRHRGGRGLWGVVRKGQGATEEVSGFDWGFGVCGSFLCQAKRKFMHLELRPVDSCNYTHCLSLRNGGLWLLSVKISACSLSV